LLDLDCLNALIRQRCLLNHRSSQSHELDFVSAVK
jgi:hypothetical protein